MPQLPHGFFDVSGQAAADRAAILDAFLATARSFGYERFFPSTVGFESTFTGFGSESGDRLFRFADRKGRALALTADSLVVAARTAAGLAASGPGPVHLYGVVPVFRYRRTRYRSWNHLLLSSFNGDGGTAGDLALPRALADLLGRLRVRYVLDCCDYGTFDAVLAARGFGAAAGRRILHEVRAGRVEGPGGEVVAALLAGAGPGPALELSGGDPAVAGRLAAVEETVAMLRGCGVPLAQNWRFDHGGEHHDGFSFVVRAAAQDGRTVDIGDGGGFHAAVRSSFPALRTAWSGALSLDVMADLGLGSAAPPPTVHMVRLDCGLPFFLRACGRVRASGTAVREHTGVRRVSRLLAGLPQADTVFFCLVGGREEAAGAVRLTSVGGRDRVVNLAVDGGAAGDLPGRLPGT